MELTAPQMRKRIQSAGVDIQDQGRRVISHKPGKTDINLGATMNDPEIELSMLQRMADTYHVPRA